MSKETKQRVGTNPTMEPVERPQALRVVARPVDQLEVPSAQDGVLTELVSGLAKINPQLQQYVQQKNTSDAISAIDQGTARAEKNTLGITDPRQALSAQEAMPETIEPAFAKHFEKGYREVVGAKMADKLSSDFLDAWAAVRMNADTDPEQFITKWGAENLAGFDDPLMLGPISKRLMETAKAIRTDARGIAMQQLERSTREGVAASFAAISPEMPVDQMMSTFYSQVVPQALQTNFFTRTELNTMLLDRVNAMSLAMGGRPELFDMLKEFKDPATGKSLYEMNPALAEKIDAQRLAADNMVQQKLERSMQTVHFQKALDWEKRAREGNPPTADEVLSQMGSMGMFKDYGSAVNAYLRYQKDADEARSLQQGLNLMRNGMGAILSEKDQKALMDRITDPHVNSLFQSASGGDMGGFNLAASQILHAHQTAKVSVPNTRLQNMFASVRQAIPAQGEAPSPTFKALAGLYAQLPPNLQASYVTDEDTRLILSRYNEGRSGGVGTQLSEETALAQAYDSVSKEAQDRAKQMLLTTEGREKVRDKISKTFTVMGWRAFLPFANAENEDVVANATTLAAKSYVERMGGNVSEKEALAWAKQWFTERFVYDTTTNRYVEVPPNSAGEATAEAIAAYTEKMVALHGKEAAPRLIHLGNGKYRVTGGTEVGGGTLGYTTIQEITDDHYATKNLDPRTREGSRLLALQNALNAGTLTPEQLTQEADLIAKARALRIWDDDMGKKIDEVRRKAFDGGFSPILKDVPKPSLDHVDQSRLPSNGTHLKADLARHYFEANHDGKALTVLAEGVVLKAYPDPATGRNIGVAYNMDANAKTLNEDFRRAGIPADAVEDVKTGRKAITREQAMRLFEVAYSRAEKSAQSSIERIYGKGHWERLPSNRKAVLVDVAYQVGSVDQFKPTLDKFISELGEAKDQNLVVHFRDRKTGQMRPDTPRNNMRLAVLNGGSAVKALLTKVEGVPRNKIEAQALLKPQQ